MQAQVSTLQGGMLKLCINRSAWHSHVVAWVVAESMCALPPPPLPPPLLLPHRFLLARLREAVFSRLQRRRQWRHAAKAQRRRVAAGGDADGGVGAMGDSGGDAAV